MGCFKAEPWMGHGWKLTKQNCLLVCGDKQSEFIKHGNGPLKNDSNFCTLKRDHINHSVRSIDSLHLVLAPHCSLMDFERLVVAEMHSKNHNSSQALNFPFLLPSEIWLSTEPAPACQRHFCPHRSFPYSKSTSCKQKKKKKAFQLRVGGINAN